MCIQVLWPDEALGRLEQNHLFMKRVVILFQRSNHSWYSLSVSAISKLIRALPTQPNLLSNTNVMAMAGQAMLVATSRLPCSGTIASSTAILRMGPGEPENPLSVGVARKDRTG